jgi:hypothetical protein
MNHHHHQPTSIVSPLIKMSSVEESPKQLTREEQLRIWLESKKTKKPNERRPNQSNNRKSVSSRPPQQHSGNRVRRRESERSTPLSNKSTPLSSMLLFEQGTFSSRLKSKTPNDRSFTDSVSTRTPLISVHSRSTTKRPLTDPRNCSVNSMRNSGSIDGSRKSVDALHPNENENPRRPPCDSEKTDTSEICGPLDDDKLVILRTPQKECILPNKGSILCLKAEEETFVSPLSCSARSFLASPPSRSRLWDLEQLDPTPRMPLNLEEIDLTDTEDIFATPLDKYDVEGWEPENSTSEIRSNVENRNSDERLSRQLIMNVTTERRRTLMQSRIKTNNNTLGQEESDDQELEDWRLLVSPDGPEEPSSISKSHDEDPADELRIATPISDAGSMATFGSIKLSFPLHVNDANHQVSAGDTETNHVRSTGRWGSQTEGNVEGQEDIFDWRDGLSPDFAKQTVGKRRTGASMLILPKPSPKESTPVLPDTPSASANELPDVERRNQQLSFVVSRRRQNNPVCNASITDSDEILDVDLGSSKVVPEKEMEEARQPQNDEYNSFMENNFPDGRIQTRRKSRRASILLCQGTDSEDSSIGEPLESTPLASAQVEKQGASACGRGNEHDGREISSTQTSSIPCSPEDDCMDITDESSLADVKEAVPDVQAEGCPVPESVVRVADKSILEAIREQPSMLGTSQETPSYSCDACENKDSHISELRWQVDCLLIQKTKLEDRLYSMKKGYEKRVTPFRDVFEDVRKSDPELCTSINSWPLTFVFSFP